MDKKKCVVIGVTGGIAVYKALDVISALRICKSYNISSYKSKYGDY